MWNWIANAAKGLGGLDWGKIFGGAMKIAPIAGSLFGGRKAREGAVELTQPTQPVPMPLYAQTPEQIREIMGGMEIPAPILSRLISPEESPDAAMARAVLERALGAVPAPLEEERIRAADVAARNEVAEQLANIALGIYPSTEEARGAAGPRRYHGGYEALGLNPYVAAAVQPTLTEWFKTQAGTPYQVSEANRAIASLYPGIAGQYGTLAQIGGQQDVAALNALSNYLINRGKIAQEFGRQQIAQTGGGERLIPAEEPGFWERIGSVKWDDVNLGNWGGFLRGAFNTTPTADWTGSFNMPDLKYRGYGF